MNFEKVVIKVGTSTVESLGVKKIAQELSKIKEESKLVFVSSGAAGFGRTLHHQELRSERELSPKEYTVLGQPILMSQYAKEFQKKGIYTGQALVTKEVNEAILENLLMAGYLPIVNGNDFESEKDLMWNDNDTLAGRVSEKISADILVILTDIDGVYCSNPRTNENAQKMKIIHKISETLLDNSKETGSDGGTGGMYTKLLTAKLLLEYGIATYITSDIEDARNFLKYGEESDFKGTLIRKKKL